MKLASDLRFDTASSFVKKRKAARECTQFIWLFVHVDFDEACGFYDKKTPVLIFLN